ncbi:MAG: LAGLIDADG family homing endonuclease [Tepidanaerobacteraceae bacterium]
MDKKNLSFSENAKTVLKKRYLAKDVSGDVVESPEDMIQRVADAIASAEEKYANGDFEHWRQAFYDMMAELKFLPNSPTLMNAGRELGQLSACFVLPVEDSMEGIFDSIKSAALIHKSGGGTGFSFSRLRPKGATVKSTGGVASGPISFMKVFNSATEAVKQGGCVDENTRISTAEGLVKIKDLGPCDLPEDSWHKYVVPLKLYTDEGIKEADEFYVHGKAKVKKITTECGYSVTITHEHRLRVIDSDGNYVWKYAKDIKKGDWLALKKNTYPETTDYRLPEFAYEPPFNVKDIILPQEPSEDLGEFIGCFIGDGSISFNERGTGRVIFSVADEESEVLDRIISLGKKLFAVEPVINKKPEDKSSNLFYNSTVLAQWLKHIGVDKVSSMDVRVPEIAFRGGMRFAIGFLRGLFSADGYVSKEGYVTLYSVSKELIDGVKELLLALGIPSRTLINTDRRDSFGKSPVYKLNIITKEGYAIFRDKIGFISAAKNDRLDLIDDRLFEYNDVIPNQQLVFAQIYNGSGKGCGPGRTSLGANRKLYREIQRYLPNVAAPRNLNRSRLRYLVEKYKEVAESPLKWFLENDQFYDKVESIEDDEAFTLDLSVPDNNTYIAAGFISHNTRRGANMGILRVDHPDILDFIKCKKNDKEITNFNISVAITDKFMEALQKDEEYDLIDPHTNKPTGRLKAREVFELIVDMAWNNGEPGIVFIDRMNEDNPTPTVGVIESTNPCGEQPLLPFESCFAPDTRILTDKGWETVEEAYQRQQRGEQISVYTDGLVINEAGLTLRPSTVVPIGEKDIVAVELQNGQRIRVTPDHNILTQRGWVPAGQLEDKDFVYLPDGVVSMEDTIIENSEYYQMLGWMIGDGWHTQKSSGLVFGPEDDLAERQLLPVFQELCANLISPRSNGRIPQGSRDENGVLTVSCTNTGVRQYLIENGMEFSLSRDKRVPDSIMQADAKIQIEFLKGLFGAEGYVDSKRAKVSLTTASKELARDVQLLLMGLGIKSRIWNYRHRDGREWSNLFITKESLDRFAKHIGFPMNPVKQQRLKDWLQGRNRIYRNVRRSRVKSVVPAGTAFVYDVSEPVTNSLIAEGMIVHNCNLGSINLSKFVKRTRNKNQIDYDSLRETVHAAVRFLDDVIDVNKYPLQEIEKMTLANRKIGLGVMGFADMLIQLGIPYNSDEAVRIAEEVMSFIDRESKKASEELAKERGVFPNWEKSVFKDKGMRIRNATTTTIAPTGTISIIAGASSGIEPVFALAFERHVMDNERLVEVHPIFERELKDRGIYSQELMQEVIAEGSLQKIQGVPEDIKRVFVTAHDITPEWHVKIQAAFQKYTHNAVSKTVNFPNSATREDVKTVYMMAYELGCKGVTIYRDGSRQEQVLNKGTKGEKQKTVQIPPQCTSCEIAGDLTGNPLKPRPRPSVTYGTTEKVKIGCGNLYITVNSDENGICEVFTNLGRAGGCPSQSEATSRLISMALRSGIDAKSIVEQLKGIRCHSTLRQMASNKDIKVLSCPDAIGRAIERSLGKNLVPNGNNHQESQAYIKRYIDPENDELAVSVENPDCYSHIIKPGTACPECGSKLEHESGCVVCRSCGYSKCG